MPQSLALLFVGPSLLRHRPGQDGEGANMDLAREYVCFHIELSCYCPIMLYGLRMRVCVCEKQAMQL